MPRRTNTGGKSAPTPDLLLEDANLALLLSDLGPEHKSDSAHLSRNGVLRALRNTLSAAKLLVDKRLHVEKVSKEVSRITAAVDELRSALRLADPVTLRLILADEHTPQGFRTSLVMPFPPGELPWMAPLVRLEEVGSSVVASLKAEKKGGPGNLLALKLGVRNYHFALQSRVILAAYGWPKEPRTSRKVCRMSAALVGQSGKVVDEESLRQYAEQSFDYIQATPLEFEEAYLRMIRDDLAVRFPKGHAHIDQINERLAQLRRADGWISR